MADVLHRLFDYASRYMPFPGKQQEPTPGRPSRCVSVLGISPLSQSNMLVVRFAGLSGALAVGLGAYGAHVLRQGEVEDKRRLRAFDTGNRYHLIHSVVLLGTPLARFPLLTASLFVSGIVLFSGTCYHYSITGNEATRHYTPFGGILFIIAWLSFLL